MNKITLGTKVIFSSYLKRRTLAKSRYKTIKWYEVLECKAAEGILSGRALFKKGILRMTQIAAGIGKRLGILRRL